MFSKIQKGQYGYRDAHKKDQIIKVLLCGLAIIVTLSARFIIPSESLGKMLMVSAILFVLPFANFASPLLASWKHKTAPKELYDAVHPYEEKFTIYYDLIITNRDMIMPVDAAVVHPTGIYLYCPDKSIEAKKADKFLNEILVGWKLDGNAKVMLDQKAFMNRLASLRDLTEEDDDGSAEYIEKVILGLSM